jgi:Lon protease-like protein
MDLPLFPLNSVLFPGSRLELRIFEPRYLDMVRDCMRAGSGFGVCMIISGREAGEPAIPAAYGTEAHIVDFCSLPDGLLGITVEGRSRLHVHGATVRSDGLSIGQANRLPDDARLTVPAEHALLVTILQRLADADDAELAKAGKSCFDDAAWVAYRLADRMPIGLPERQQILQMNDVLQRLQQLAEWLPRFQRD